LVGSFQAMEKTSPVLTHKSYERPSPEANDRADRVSDAAGPNDRAGRTSAASNDDGGVAEANEDRTSGIANDVAGRTSGILYDVC